MYSGLKISVCRYLICMLYFFLRNLIFTFFVFILVKYTTLFDPFQILDVFLNNFFCYFFHVSHLKLKPDTMSFEQRISFVWRAARIFDILKNSNRVQEKSFLFNPLFLVWNLIIIVPHLQQHLLRGLVQCKGLLDLAFEIISSEDWAN